MERLIAGGADKRSADAIKEIKRELFAQIRDAVMGIRSGDDFYTFSPIFKHFDERHIMKLDYNEGDRVRIKDAAHAGSFQRPERILTTRKPILGQIYRLQTAHSADSISAGAVTEALANDLTRIAGVPAQELEIVRGEYSDGHPKLMLQAKFADGYKDMEAGFIKDGRIVPPKGQSAEKLGKYKAFFLLTADRDAVGRRGQNKGFAHGKFFAIDPGHSLEGNAKYLKVSDDLSFKDTYGRSTKPRFENFSVFDDDTFFSKMEGVVNLRETAKRGEFKDLFDKYREAFNPNAEGISDAEKALRTKIIEDINKKEAEFNESLKKILDVSVNNLDLYDDLSDQPESVRRGAIENLANLEKLTSATTWTSKKGKVALEHLEVVPETRVPWKGVLKDDSIVFFTETKMSYRNLKQLEDVVTMAGAKFEDDAMGVTRITVPLDKAEKFFAAFNEEKVQQLTHPAEYMARKEGRDGLKEATIYKPVPCPNPGPDPRPLMTVDQLPEQIDFEVDGLVYKFPKIHYQDLISVKSSVHRPRNEGELRNPLPGSHFRQVVGAPSAQRGGASRPPLGAGEARQGRPRRADERQAQSLQADEPEHSRAHVRAPRDGAQEGRVHVPRLVLDRGQERRHRALARQGGEPLHPHVDARKALPEGACRRTPQHAARIRRADGRGRSPERHEDVPLLHDPGRGRAQERRQRKRPQAPALPQVRDVRHLLLDGAREVIRQV